MQSHGISWLKVGGLFNLQKRQLRASYNIQVFELQGQHNVVRLELYRLRCLGPKSALGTVELCQLGKIA